MNLKTIKLGKANRTKTIQDFVVPKIPTFRIRQPKNLPPFTLSHWTGEKSKALIGYHRKFGVWPNKVLHWVDGLGADHWAMMFPK